MIETAIYTRLSGYTALTNLVSTRIYPGAAPDEVIFPYVVYSRVTTRRFSVMTEDTGIVQATFQFDIYDDDYDGSVDVSAEVQGAMQRWSGTVDSIVIQDTFLENELDLYDDRTNSFHRVLDFEINHLE